MIYKSFAGCKLSALGMGAMRFPRTEDGEIDRAATAEMIDYAIANGVNYFDTAWGYHDGKSEIVLGELLARYPRECFYLADKFPGYSLANLHKVAEIFEKQLAKCGVDYFDFYLFHNVNELNIDHYLDPKYGIYDYLMEQKRAGRIRHLGFSEHATLDTVRRFLEAYGKDIEFCQIQLNYLDYDFQDAKAKLALLAEWGIPVWVMEPLRGGKLASLTPEETARLAALRPEEKVPAWAFRFLQTIPQVTVTLSGMSSFTQVAENIATFSEEKPLAQNEWDTLIDIAKEMTRRTVVSCTGCRYCTKGCPAGLDIPRLLALYNEHVLTGGGFIAPTVLAALPEDKRPTACISCERCEEACPQKISVSEVLADFVRRTKK